MKRKLIAFIMALAMIIGTLPAAAFAETAEERSSGAQTSVACSYTVENPSGNTFSIRRSGDLSRVETVYYRTVSLSALAGVHFTAKSGSFTFNTNEDVKTVTVTLISGVNGVYKYVKDDTVHTYRFEVLDAGGFELAHLDKNIGGTSVNSSNVYANETVTVIAGETTVTDSGYAQAYHSVPIADYFDAAAAQEYLTAAGAELRMTVDFNVKEKDDGYQYIQILANQVSNCDTGAGDGDPGTINYSRYMAGFGHRPSSTETDYAPYSFPVTSYGDNCGEHWQAWSDLGNTVGKLYQQRFKTNCRASDGRLIIPTDLSTLGIRFNASGNNNDTWYANNVKAKIQAVDETAPTVLSASEITLSAGPYKRGNTFYISVPFSEIVNKVSGGNPSLTTTWGIATYVSGSGTNVLTFEGTINAVDGMGLSITAINNKSFIKDLAGKAFADTISKTFSGKTASASYAYTIGYGLNGGTLPSGYPATYTYDAAVTLTNPALDHYDFAGWTGSNGSAAETSVTIPAGTHGDMSYTANWTPTEYTITYDLAGGSLPEGQTNPATYTVESPEFTLVNPVREGYTFMGWTGTMLSGTVMTVTVPTGSFGDRSYTANWRTITYSITYDLAGGFLNNVSNPATYDIESGSFTLANPERVDYTFIGWTGTGLNGLTMTVTVPTGSFGDRSYTAHWQPVAYGITYDLVGGSLPEGQTNPATYTVESPEFTLVNPVREGYTFMGWTGTMLSGTVMTVTVPTGSFGDRSYTAHWNTVEYSITYDLVGGSLPNGQTNPAVYDIESDSFTLVNPEREGCIFLGWTGTGLDGLTMTVTVPTGSFGDRSYTANWSAVITFVNHDGTVLYSAQYMLGEIPSYPYDSPTRDADAQYTYYFSGWSPEIVSVTGAATYTAHYNSVLNEYTVTFKNWDGTELLSSDWEYGSTPSYPGTPTRDADAQYTYYFSGWSPEIVSVTGTATYTAQYNSILNEYTVTFINWDGTELQSSDWAYGSTPSYSGTPTRLDYNGTYYTAYTFTGWSPEVVSVTRDAEYTAQYSIAYYYGSCGANVTWRLENGVLTISGTGNMDDYSIGSRAPWYDLGYEITSAVIESGVTSIGKYAFSNCLYYMERLINGTCISVGSADDLGDKMDSRKNDAARPTYTTRRISRTLSARN